MTCHHVVFRAHQGREELENLTSPYEFCRAPELRWELGRDPILVVEGRELRDAR
ncbi:MAG: hypothetical protein KF901_23790 [Myxococcales bacterium]|nr:hypothetical protein [Myxococcales bacterium]